MAIDRKRRRGECACTERALRHALGGVDKTPGIALEHCVVGEQMVGQPNRLCALQMCVPGNEGIEVRFGLLHECLAEIRDSPAQG